MVTKALPSALLALLGPLELPVELKTLHFELHPISLPRSLILDQLLTEKRSISLRISC